MVFVSGGDETPVLMESLTLLHEYGPKRPPSHVFAAVPLIVAEQGADYY